MVRARRPAPRSSATAIDLTEDDSDEAEVSGSEASAGEGDEDEGYGPSGYCPRCRVWLVESAVLAGDDDNGVEEQGGALQSAATPATSENYVALIQCACCLRSFGENDEEAFPTCNERGGPASGGAKRVI